MSASGKNTDTGSAGGGGRKAGSGAGARGFGVNFKVNVTDTGEGAPGTGWTGRRVTDLLITFSHFKGSRFKVSEVLLCSSYYLCAHVSRYC